MVGEERPSASENLADDFIDNFGHLIGKGAKKKRGGTKKEGVYTKKLTDGFDKDPYGAANKIPDPKGDYATVPRPFDCFATLDGRCVVFEAKYDNGYAPITLTRFSATQKQNLDKYDRAGALACIVWFFKISNRVRMVVVPYRQVVQTGTIRKKQVEQLPYDVVKGGVFPVDQFRGLLGG